MSAWWCEQAWLPGGVRPRVRIDEQDGAITAVTEGTDPHPGDQVLTGLTYPGFANAHSHAFHRALRGRTHDRGGTFWTWRRDMYALAAVLTPDSYQRLATAVYAEMALAGVTAVGEFHYLHHGPGGTPYAEPNEMGHALHRAARDAGIRLTLLDTCYLAGGLDADGYQPLDQVQRRFGDGDAERWAARVAALRPDADLRIGAAAHSVRAVPRDQLTHLRGPLVHVHVSEQPAENEACRAVHGRTPVELLHEEGLLGPGTTAVHATHLTTLDVSLLGSSRTTACFCPTTEQDLADGIGPARDLLDAGSPLTLGSDQHATVDLLGEARALEMHERLNTRERGRFSPAQLVTALTGHASLGWDGGRIAPGAPADLVAVDTGSVRTAGADPAQLVLAATAADVRTVVVAGRTVVENGEHRLGDVGTLLAQAIAEVTA